MMIREKATRASWRIQKRPRKTRTVSLFFQCSPEDYELLRYGFVPQEMEDKWFVFEAERSVHFIRSWTGLWHGSLRFERTESGFNVVDGCVNVRRAGDESDARKLADLARQVIEANGHLPRRGRRSARIDSATTLGELFVSNAIALERSSRFDTSPEPLRADLDFERIEGMLLGIAIGDALGNTTEGQTPGVRRSRFGEITGYLPTDHAEGRAVGIPSDDSQMAFWTLEQLNADGGLVPERLARRLSCQRIFGIGHSVKDFVHRFKDEKNPWQTAGVQSAGNGALMRIAPVLLPYLRQPSPDLWADAAITAMITHNDRASTAASIAFVSILWHLLGMRSTPDPGWWVEEFVRVAMTLEGQSRLKPRFGPHVGSYEGPLSRFVQQVVPGALSTHRSVVDACAEWGSGAYLLETMPSVLYIWLHGPIRRATH